MVLKLVRNFALVNCLIVAGCMQVGRPIVMDKSGQATPPKPSFEKKTSSRNQLPRPKSQGTKSPGEPIPPRKLPRTPPRTPHKSVSVERHKTPGSYLVRGGDTVYSIAWRYQLDFQQLTRANALAAPYTIYPGQTLRLGSVTTSNLHKAKQPKTTRQNSKQNTRPNVVATSTQAPASKVIHAQNGEWVWPVGIAPSGDFTKARKGLDFTLQHSANIKAAAAGVVVYAGNGIGGYERLVIIKHTQALLSAYSFNGNISVAEQQSVKAGAQVADIINTGRGSQTLHFELRRNGQPEDPRRKLPKRNHG